MHNYILPHLKYVAWLPSKIKSLNLLQIKNAKKMYFFYMHPFKVTRLLTYVVLFLYQLHQNCSKKY